jgi:hypothetical protein
MNNLFKAMLISSFVLFATNIFADTHQCPRLSAIKNIINNKDYLSIGYHTYDGFGGVKSNGYAGVNFFDEFETNETWVFHFDVENVENKDEAWNLFQHYLDTQPDIARVATDSKSCIDSSHLDSGRWICHYPYEGVGTRFITVFAVAKAP